MALKSILKGVVGVGAFVGVVYGIALGEGKLLAEMDSGKRVCGTVAEVLTWDLREISYTKKEATCTIDYGCAISEKGGPFYPNMELTDFHCDGTVDVIETDMREVERDDSSEALFQKADRKFEAIVKEYGLRERVEKYSAESEDLNKYFE